ncbi:hypothetical protein AOLI_G00235160 [Acnodon oligacanthus]
MNDLYLLEGWYSFTGIGGDRLGYQCLNDVISNEFLLNDTESSTDFYLNTCDTVTGCTWSLDCGGGLILYYLTPVNRTYTTCHSSCSASSCGPSVHCNAADGSCVCDSGLSAPVGFLTAGHSYTCTGAGCAVNCSVECAEDLLSQVLNPPQVMPKNVVAEYLNEGMNCMKAFEDATTDEDKLVRYGDSVLKATEKLVSGLVMKTDTIYSTSISLQTLEVQVFVVGPNASLSKIPRLNTSKAYLDIGLTGILKHKDQFVSGRAAVALISYTNLSNMLKTRFSTMVSNVVSVSLLNTPSKRLSKPFKLTLSHTTELHCKSALSCMTWNDTEWVDGDCRVVRTNRSHTVCSCNYPATFAVIKVWFKDRFPALRRECKVVEKYLKEEMQCMQAFMNATTDEDKLASYGTSVLKATEKLVAGLVNKTDTYYSTNIDLHTLKVHVVVVGPDASLTIIPQLNTSKAHLDIDLIGISMNNNGSAAVALISYTRLSNFLKPRFSTMVSAVMSVTLLNTPNKRLSEPFNITVKHTKVVDYATLSCVSWEDTQWVYGSCSIIWTNGSHTVCSCNDAATIAVISEWFFYGTGLKQVNCSVECAVDLQSQILNISAQVIRKNVIAAYLNAEMNCMRAFKNTTTDQGKLVSYWNSVLKTSEKLVSGLVMKTDTYYYASIPLKTLEVQVFVVGPNASLSKIPRLNTSKAYLDIGLTGISTDNNGTAAVALISYIKFPNRLKLRFTVVSTVVLVTLLNTPSAQLSGPFNVTLNHTKMVDSDSKLSCVAWDNTTWVNSNCSIIWSNSSQTVCSCLYPAAFAVVSAAPRQGCKVNCSADCAVDFLSQILNSSAQVKPKNIEKYLKMEMRCLKAFMKATTDKEKLVSYWNSVLNATEKLVSRLLMKTDTYNSTNIALKTLEVQVSVVGPNASMTKTPQLSTSNACLDIDLIRISKNNSGNAAVALISFTNLSAFLNTNVTMVSTVVSVTLLNTTNTQLSKPFKLTLSNQKDGKGTASCMTWKETEWVDGNCSIHWSNSSHTVCTCNYTATIAIISSGSTKDFSYLRLLTMVAKSVAVVFLAFTLLTFAVCRRQPNMQNMAQVNLCMSLMLTHILFLLRGTLLSYIKANTMACPAVAGILHFLYLSAFMWMFIDAVLLFISVKNLTRVRTNQREVLGKKSLIAIGYGIPLVMVGVCAAAMPVGYGSAKCGLKADNGFSWSFLGPVFFIFSLNIILFIAIFIIIAYTLKNLNGETLQRAQTLADKKVITSVLLKTMAQFVILGCPWILYVRISQTVVYILYEVFLSLQAILIFLIYCVLNQEVRRQYRRWMSTVCPCTVAAGLNDMQMTERGASRFQSARITSG